MSDPLELDVTPEDLARTTLFRSVNVSLILDRLRTCERRKIAAGETLIQQGQDNKALYVVLRGHLYIRLDHAEQAEISVVVMGDCIGEMSVIDGRQATASVIAEVDSVLLVLPRDLVWMLIDHFGEVSRNLLYILAGRLRLGDHLIAAGTHATARQQRVATFDLVTQVRNRRWFEDELTRLTQGFASAGVPLSLIVFEVQHMDRINTAHGRRAGDLLLQRAARAAHQAVDGRGVPARIGGIEFGVLLPGVDKKHATALSAAIFQAVAQLPPSEHEGRTLESPTIKLGIAGYKTNQTHDELVNEAMHDMHRLRVSIP